MELKAIVFSDDELERILEYKEQAGAVDARVAVLNAISVASDRLEFKDDMVVRCKDCKYGRNAVSAYADMYCVRSEKCVTAEWYCADGEKKEGAK